jgi:hypothetical protein
MLAKTSTSEGKMRRAAFHALRSRGVEGNAVEETGTWLGAGT